MFKYSLLGNNITNFLLLVIIMLNYFNIIITDRPLKMDNVQNYFLHAISK